MARAPIYVVDPADPRAPSEEVWARLSDEERRQVVAALPSGEDAKGELEAVRSGLAEERARTEEHRVRADEERGRAEKAERALEAERARAEDAERKLAAALAEIEALRRPR